MVIRVNKNKNYTTMSNYHLRDKNLSFKAKGLLSMMLSLPDDWEYSIKGLVAISKENETSVKNTLNELKENKYLVVTKLLPNQTNNGRIGYVYDIYEIPQKQEGEKQGVENLGLEFLGVEKQGVENQGQLNTNILNTKELNINNKNSCSSYNNNKGIFEFYEEKFGRTITGLEYEKINYWLKDFNEDIIKYAIDICVSNNKNSYSYLNGILKNWKSSGYKNLSEIKSNTISTREKEQPKELFDYDWLNEEENEYG